MIYVFVLKENYFYNYIIYRNFGYVRKICCIIFSKIFIISRMEVFI